MRRIIGYPVEEQNEPERGWFGTRPQDRTARSTHRKKQCLLLRRPDGCGGGANDAERKGRRSSCGNPRKIAGRNNKYRSDCREKIEKSIGTSEIPRLRAPQSGVRYRYSTTNQR